MKANHRNNGFFNMKHSIAGQLIGRCTLLILFITLFYWLANVFFLETFYIKSREAKLMETYELLYEYSKSGYRSGFDEEIRKLCSTYNVSYIITDASSNTVKTSIDDPRRFNKMLRQIILASSPENFTLIKESNDYVIGNLKDEADEMEYLTMWGTLADGKFFMIRSAISAIEDTVGIFNSFIFQVGMAGILAAFVVAYFISKKIARPIGELTVLSKKMTELDFSSKYQDETGNEIDILGENFNKMSESLEGAISQLKNANASLTEDVMNKTRIDNMRKEFIANVSHELKTPIAIISGYAEGLKEAVNDDPQSMDFYCDVIMDEANKMNHMVKQLMQLNSLEFGGITPELERFNLVELIKNYLDSSKIILTNDEKLEFCSDIKDATVMADEYLIEEVFRNYFINAVHHADFEKNIRVHILQDETPGYIRVNVYNDGENIPEESVPYLWDKFYKVDKARTREYGGSGVGLSIVKAVMEEHHGKYGVTNAPGGVNFYFSLEKC